MISHDKWFVDYILEPDPDRLSYSENKKGGSVSDDCDYVETVETYATSLALITYSFTYHEADKCDIYALTAYIRLSQFSYG